MCFMLMLAVFRDQSKDSQGKYQLNGIETAVYARMALYANESGASIYPSVNTLIAELKFSRRTIQRVIKSLLEKRRIILVKAGNSKTHLSSEYRINLTILPKYLNVKSPNYDDSVDKLCTTPSVRLVKGGVRETLGASVRETPHNHIIQSTTNYLNKEENPDLENDLLKIKIDPQKAKELIHEFGFTMLTEILVEMMEYERKTGIKIKDKEKYLDDVMDGYRDRW